MKLALQLLLEPTLAALLQYITAYTAGACIVSVQLKNGL